MPDQKEWLAFWWRKWQEAIDAKNWDLALVIAATIQSIKDRMERQRD